MIAALNAISHFLVDWTCVCALYSSGAEGPALAMAAVLYNTLAFSTQCLAGLLLDIPARARRLGCEGHIEPGGQGGASGSRRPGGPVRFCGLWQAGGMLLVALGALIPAGLIVRVAILDGNESGTAEVICSFRLSGILLRGGSFLTLRGKKGRGE